MMTGLACQTVWSSKGAGGEAARRRGRRGGGRRCRRLAGRVEVVALAGVEVVGAVGGGGVDGAGALVGGDVGRRVTPRMLRSRKGCWKVVWSSFAAFEAGESRRRRCRVAGGVDARRRGLRATM